jgi:hypothetical protein
MVMFIEDNLVKNYIDKGEENEEDDNACFGGIVCFCSWM